MPIYPTRYPNKCKMKDCHYNYDNYCDYEIAKIKPHKGRPVCVSFKKTKRKKNDKR